MSNALLIPTFLEMALSSYPNFLRNWDTFLNISICLKLLYPNFIAVLTQASFLISWVIALLTQAILSPDFLSLTLQSKNLHSTNKFFLHNFKSMLGKFENKNVCCKLNVLTPPGWLQIQYTSFSMQLHICHIHLEYASDELE